MLVLVNTHNSAKLTVRKIQTEPNSIHKPIVITITNGIRNAKKINSGELTIQNGGNPEYLYWRAPAAMVAGSTPPISIRPISAT